MHIYNLFYLSYRDKYRGRERDRDKDRDRDKYTGMDIDIDIESDSLPQNKPLSTKEKCV